MEDQLLAELAITVPSRRRFHISWLDIDTHDSADALPPEMASAIMAAPAVSLAILTFSAAPVDEDAAAGVAAAGRAVVCCGGSAAAGV